MVLMLFWQAYWARSADLTYGTRAVAERGKPHIRLITDNGERIAP